MKANTGAAHSCAAMVLRYGSTVCLLAALLLPFNTALAEVTTRDLQVTARTLGFLDPPYTGEVRMGLLYDPGSTRASQQAEEVRRLLGNGLAVGNLRLQPVLVSLPEAGRADVNFFFLLEDAGANASTLQTVLAQRKLPCLTTDLEQVRAGICAVGIQSVPKVEILVNRAAASASDLRFATVFRMMIVEL